jgi:hypothetical protein
MRILPFGYRAKGGRAVPDPAEQRALAVMRGLRSKGQSLRDIGQALTDQGHKPRLGDRWDSGTLRQIIAADLSKH